MGNIEVKVPAFSEQQRIGDTLSALDKKIATNHQESVALEQIAQTFFKRWFVDFEFPNEKERPYKSSGGN